MSTRSRIENWAKKNFKFSKPFVSDMSDQVAKFRSEMVAQVHENSPAFFMGIKAGWFLLRVDGAAYNAETLLRKKYIPKGFGSNLYEFYDPKQKQVYKVKSKFWPFGITLLKPPLKVAEGILSGDNFDWSDIHNLWTIGLIDETADLYPALEAGCAELAGGSRPTSLPPTNDPFPETVHADALASLALSAFAAGHINRAKFVNSEAAKAINNQPSVSGYTLALQKYLESVFWDLEGRKDAALVNAREALHFKPDIPELHRNIETLTGERSEIQVPFYVGTEFDLGYNLPNIDPVNEIKSTGKLVSFQKTLDDLSQGQLLLVFIMGSYRSNSYYIDDLITAGPIFKTFNHKVKHIHVIVESDYTLSPEDRRIFEKNFIKQGQPLTILFDENGTIAPRLQTSGYPSRLFYEKSGRVVCDEKLWDESGIWHAFGST